MRAFAALLRKEVFSLFVSPYIYLLLGTWFLLNGLFFSFILGYPAVEQDLTLFPQFLFGSGLLVWLLLPAFPPLLTLKLFAEEQRTGTLEPLLSAPIRDIAIVAAKYCAAWLFFFIFWIGVLLLFLLLEFHQAPLDWARVGGGFLGAISASSLFLATGLWASSWGGNLILAAGGGACINFLLLFLPVLFENSPGRVGALAKSLHIPNMLDRAFAVGLFDSYALLFFPIMTLLFLWLTWVRLVSRRWVP